MKYRVAAVLEPHAARYTAIAQGLKKAGLKVTGAKSVEDLGKEQLVVLGASAPSPSRLAREVRKAVPSALVMAARTKGFTAAWADAVLPLPVSPNDLKVRLVELSDAKSSQPMLAVQPGEGILDPSTNFYTFSHFKEVLFIEVKRARRYGFPLALALVGFDPITGHPPGEGHVHEQLMGGLALAIRRSLRDTDFPVHHSVDRVLLLMPHTDLAGSLIVARRICERVAKASLQVGDELVHPTISVGVAAGAPGKEYSFSDLVRQAQEGLAAAMAQGGNRVEFLDAEAHAPQPLKVGEGIPRIPPVVPAR